MVETSDELLGRAQGGDRSATEALLRQHTPKVLAVCRRLCSDYGDAEDAAQEALIAVVRGLPRFDGRSSLSTWIYRITTNACLDELRRRRRRPQPADLSSPAVDMASGYVHHTGAAGQPDPESEVLRSETRTAISAALATLPEEFRVAVVLRDVADLDYATIAEVLDVPVGTVRSRIARGRDRLATSLSTEVATEFPGTDSADAPSESTEMDTATSADGVRSTEKPEAP